MLIEYTGKYQCEKGELLVWKVPFKEVITLREAAENADKSIQKAKRLNKDSSTK